MKARWLFLFALLAGALLTLSACAQETIVTGGKQRPSYPERLVSLSPNASEWIAIRCVSAAKIVGRTSSCTNPALGRVEVVVDGTKPNFEKIANLRPDLIFLDSMLYSQADIDKLKEIAEVVDVNATSFAEFQDRWVRVGSKLSAETSISEYFDQINAEMNAAKAAMDGRPSPKVAVLLAGGEYMALGKQTVLADLIGMAGGTFVGPDAKKYETLNVEKLIEFNPDIIFTMGSGADKVMGDGRLATVTAVKAKDVYDIDEKAANTLLSPDQIIKSMNSRFARWGAAQLNK